MMATESQTVMLGRRDYGHGVTATLVVIDGEPFAEYAGFFYSPCGFCSPQWSGTKDYHLGVYGGVCFQCTGKGYARRYESRAKIEALVKRRKSDRARADRKRQEADAAAAAKVAEWEQAHPDEAAVLASLRAMADESTEAAYAVEERWGAFLWSLASQASYRPLSPKQTAAVMGAVARVANREAEAAAKAAGQRYYDGAKAVAAPGVVTVAITVDTAYGASRLVVVEGTGDYEGVTFKMFGTGVTLWEARRGDKVEVTGSVKDRDEYEGTPQTVLTRAKIVVTEAAPEE